MDKEAEAYTFYRKLFPAPGQVAVPFSTTPFYEVAIQSQPHRFNLDNVGAIYLLEDPVQEQAEV